MTTYDAIAQFLESRRIRCVPRIIEWYASHLQLFAAWLTARGVSQLVAVQEHHVSSYIAELRAQPSTRGRAMSPVTITKRVTAIRTFFRWSTQTGLLAADPLQHLPRLKLGQRLPKTLTPEQMRRLLTATMPPRERALFYLMLDTGLRLGEIAGLELCDLDLERGTARVKGKGDKERCVVFGSQTRTALRAWLADRRGAGRTVFELTPTGIYKSIKRVAQRVGLGDVVHPHALRHTFATEYLEAGGSLLDAKELLGHTDVRTTMIYLSISLERLRAKHERLSPVNRLHPKG